MPIASYPSIVLDCPDAHRLAEFYGALLDWRLEPQEGWVDLKSDFGMCLSFQSVDDYRPPTWPTQEVPQQMHLDVVVESLDAAEQEVVALGATRAEHQPGETFRVFLDPAGHPFCLCLG